jgi:penicillin-binding protein 2
LFLPFIIYPREKFLTGMDFQDKVLKTERFQDDYLELTIGNTEFRWRVIIIYILLVLILAFIFINAFQLQIVEGSKSLLVANRTNQSQVRSLAPRGLIYDINGIRLAQNVPSYSFFVKPGEIAATDEVNLIKEIAGLIGMNGDELYNAYKDRVYNDQGERSTADRVTLRSDLNFDEYYALLSRLEDFKGVYLNVEPVRKYDGATHFANIIGYIGDPGPEDIKKGIFSESQVGKNGIEKQYDSFLRGTEGLTTTRRETLTGNQTASEITEPKPGNNVYLSLDSRWQTKLSEILSRQVQMVNAFGGAGVIMNAQTGEIKALVTAPNYDNNLFAKGISSKDFTVLINDIHKPLINRPIGLQLPPGSIMKVFGATAALESGTIDINTKKTSDRCMDLPGNIRFCEADLGYIGSVNVQEALARSSNIFFCRVMQDMHNKPGYSYYLDIAKNFGMGSLTGIDINGEVSGTMASPELKKKLTNQQWYIGDECNTVIGQGFVTVTPLQMTVAVSALMNGGNIMKPQLMEKITDQEGNIVMNATPEVVRKLNVSNKTLNIVKDGLRMGVTSGTAGAMNTLPGYVAAKTGSSDAGEWINGKYISGAHSWVMGCFDYENTPYCFTVMQQWGGRGYKTVPIMKKFINCVYNDFANNCDAIN